MIQEVRNKLISLSDEKYKIFSSSLIPNIDNLLGVRLPILRKLAKEIAHGDWEEFLNAECQYMEETMLQGMVIGLKGNLHHVESFVPKIDNWSVCDSFCCSLKFTKYNQSEVWEFIQKYLNSNKEYYIRFGAVMILNYFVEEKYLEKIFEYINRFSNKEYYAQMAVAWLVSVCFIKFPDKTFDFLKHTILDDSTYNKSIQKITESLKIDKITKQKIKRIERDYDRI